MHTIDMNLYMKLVLLRQRYEDTDYQQDSKSPNQVFLHRPNPEILNYLPIKYIPSVNLRVYPGEILLRTLGENELKVSNMHTVATQNCPSNVIISSLSNSSLRPLYFKTVML